MSVADGIAERKMSIITVKSNCGGKVKQMVMTMATSKRKKWGCAKIGFRSELRRRRARKIGTLKFRPDSLADWSKIWQAFERTGSLTLHSLPKRYGKDSFFLFD